MILLLGGVPTTGKTTIAQNLATKFRIPYISTDTLRAWTIEILGREVYFKDFPMELDLSLEDYIGRQSAQEIVNREVNKNKLIFNSIKSFIKSNWVWKDYIIEGTGIQPDLIKELGPDFVSTFLIYQNKETIRDRIFTRGLWDEPDKYEASYKEKEVEWVWQYNEILRKECGLNRLPIIEIDNLGVEQICEKIKFQK